MTDTPQPLHVAPRRLLAAVMVAVLGLMVAAGLAVIVLSAASAVAAPELALGVVAGLAVVVALGNELSAAWHLWRSPGPVVVIGPEGLWDRRLSAAPIPWQALRWRRVTRSTKRSAMDAVRFELAGPEAQSAAPRLRLPARLMAPVNRLAGLLPYAVSPVGLDTHTHWIAEACARYQPPAD